MKSTAFIGGSLSFKGDKKKTNNKKKAHKKGNDIKHNNNIASNNTRQEEEDTTTTNNNNINNNYDDDLTETERRTMERRIQRENIELRTAVLKSHRERVEEFNEKLSSQTEHNDIPRVSAAGNG